MVSLRLVVARFNSSVTEQMEDAARDAAAGRDAAVVEATQILGTYDSSFAAGRLTRRDDVDAVVVIDVIVTDDADHDRVVANVIVKSPTRVPLDRDKPVSSGASGPGMSGAEARRRVSKGVEAVYIATDMVEALA